MPKSNNNLKLCHIFCRQPPKVSVPSNAVSISTRNAKDDGKSNIGSISEDEDDDDYDDNLPLISLMRSEQSTKEKKRRLEYVSAYAANACCIENENDNPHTVTTNNNKNQKKKKNMGKENAFIRSKESMYPRIAVEVATATTTTTTNTAATATSNSRERNSHVTRSNNRSGCDTYVEFETIASNKSEVKKDRLSLSSPQNTKSETATIKNRSRPRRFYSDSAMDFIAPSDRSKSISNNNKQQDEIQQYCSNSSDSIANNNNNRNRNIVSKIDARITNGGNLLQHRHSLPSQRSSSQSPGHWPKKWKTPSWISLVQKPLMGGGFGLNRSNGNGSGNGSGSIDHMTWDAMGVLLAVATGRTISIYDWDIFRAADIQGRSDCVRNCPESEWKIPPIVQFSLPSPVASLVWNPYNMDELAVGFRVSGQMRIYNVDRVARDQSRNNRCTPPQNTYQSIALQRITGSVCDILFLDVDNVLVSVGSFLFRWKIQSSNEKRQKRGSLTTAGGTLVWRYQPPSIVTSLAPIGSNIVVVGTNRGHLCLLDWTKRTKENSLSNGHRPKVLQNWIPHDRLDGPKEDRSLRMQMGIMKLRVETSSNECVTGKSFWGRCRVMWVTQCGWLLSVILESARIRQNCLVHHSSPKVVFRNADGSLINTDDRRSWSLPYHPIGVDMSSQVACWIGVPTITKVLAHHDKFVLDSQPHTVVSKKRVLMVYTFDKEIRSIQLPKAVKDLPQSLVVHPSLEWILVGEGRKIHILVGRDLKGISSCRTLPKL
mmetsp:Transcript_13469/g.15390  ORF Transcript_13469/g.15390 Transcript_13469/m.15390 type:complete len:769 (-) Transcript_13469:64-2370(-)